MRAEKVSSAFFALLFALNSVPSPASEPSLPPGVVNSQKAGDVPLPPLDALKKITVPDGFRAQLFAGEPDVMQPIAMDEARR